MTVTHAELDGALVQARLGSTATELHGSIAGYLCVGRGGSAHELLAALELESDGDTLPASLEALLDAVCGDVASRLRTGAPVLPLLPSGGVPVRANAMVDWCRGFLGGLGLTGVAGGADAAPDMRGILDLFGQIAARRLECDDGDGVALVEVIDFLGTGVARLHAALAPAVVR